MRGSPSLAGLGGALIGATATVVGQMLANRHAREADRRRELVDLVARFWGAADRLWRTTEGLNVTVVSLVNAEQSAHHEAAQLFEPRRQTGLAEQHAADTEALFLIRSDAPALPTGGTVRTCLAGGVQHIRLLTGRRDACCAASGDGGIRESCKTAAEDPRTARLTVSDSR